MPTPDVEADRKAVSVLPSVHTTQATALPVVSTKQNPPIFSTQGSQSNGKSSLKRMEFSFQGKSYKFIFNPEEFSQVEPSRINITQTKAGAWVDDFGGGLQKIALKGTTGFKGTAKDPTSGYTKFKELRDLIRTYYFKQSPGTEVLAADELVFHNYTDGEHWVVVPNEFSLMRSVSRPLMYMYNIQLTCLRSADTPLLQDGILSPVLAKLPVDLTSSTSLYSKVSDSFIKGTLDPSIKDVLYNPTHNLSAILGDDNGILSRSTAKAISNAIQVISPGVLILGQVANIIKSKSFPINDVLAKISPEAYSLYQQISSLNSVIVNSLSSTTSTSSTSSSVSSPLLSPSIGDPLIRNLCAAIYLESLNIYKQSLSATAEDGFSKLSKTDIQMLDNNIRWTTAKLEGETSPSYELIEVLRDLQKTISYISTQPFLFQSTYKSKLNSFQKLMSGGLS